MSRHLSLFGFPALLVTVALCGSQAASQLEKRPHSGCNYKVAGIERPSDLRDFVVALKNAVARDDRPLVAGMIRYPIRVWISKKRQSIHNRREFLRKYDLVLTALVKRAIADQDVANLFCNYQGAMIHNGEVWIGAMEDGKLKVIAFNPPIPK